MLEVFEYPFMRRAFIVGTLVAIILPCMGLPILLKRLAMMGETLSHASLAGVVIGLCFGINPVFSALTACILAGISVEIIRNKLKAYQEISTPIILATSIGLAGVFTSFAGSGKTISSYLFGSIVTIGDEEFYLVILITAVVLIAFKLIYDRLYLSIFDPAAAKLLGIRTSMLNGIFSFLVAITVSIAVKTIGSMIVSSLLILPVICAMRFAKTYKGTLFLSIGLSLMFVYIGLFLSYFFNLRPGAVIVLIAVAFLILFMLIKKR